VDDGVRTSGDRLSAPLSPTALDDGKEPTVRFVVTEETLQSLNNDKRKQKFDDSRPARNQLL